MLPYHLLIEGIFRLREVLRKTAKLLRGYQGSIALIATKLEFSYFRTLIRYGESVPNRATPKEHYDGIVEHLVDNLRELNTDKFLNQIPIYLRDRTCDYDSEADDSLAAAVLQECLFGKWNKAEEERFRELNKVYNNRGD